jgi:uncharacterized membrane protein YqjE
MAERERPLLAELAAELAALRSELAEMLALRWQLARLELEADLRLARRLAVVFAAAAVMTLTALPLWASAAAELLDGRWGIGRAGWLAVFGAVLLAAAALGTFVAWRRFRAKLVGLRETLEELHEDLVWLREWRGED